jgi:SulP family sulfate permease
VVAGTLAIVASLETLLSLEATDRLDPLKRTAPANRELLAQGVGNVVAGLAGGLPMTGVIVRSSANIDAGARTRWASFTHGTLLLVAVLLVPAVLNYIPLAALAAVLIFTGGKLARPSVVRATWRQGFKQFAPFAITVVAILATDLLVGIGIGMAAGAFFILYDNYRTPYFYHREDSADRRDIRISLSEDVTFLNKASVRQLLEEIPAGRHLTIDGSHAVHIDPDVLEILHNYRDTAAERGVEVTLVHVPEAPAGVGAH